MTKRHPYMLPIHTIKSHKQSSKLISADSKSIRIMNEKTGELFTTVESKHVINGVAVYQDSGLLLVPCENRRIGTYYIPDLGKAPDWCSFLDNMTEENEEARSENIYDEYKFLTLEEIEKLGAKKFIGTKFLKSYMHGFIMKSKMYMKLKQESQPFDYEKYRKEKVEKKLENEFKDRIYVKNPKAKVNRKVLEKIKAQGSKKKQKEADAKMAIFDDPRFQKFTEDTNFEVNEEEDAFKLRNPSIKPSSK